MDSQPDTGRALARLRAVLLNPRFVALVLLALAITAALQEYFLGPKDFGGGAIYTHYNNFRIFKLSFLHLVHGEDLYAVFPLEHWDHFKYSPAFAVMMAPFAFLPDVVGLVLWNVLNVAVLIAAFARVPGLSPRDRALIGLFIAPELLTAVQNTQANVLVAGMLILALCFLESDRPAPAALLIVAAGYVKIYPVLGAVLFLLYPRKTRFIAWSAAWLVILAAVPLLFVAPGQLRGEYASWARLLSTDQSTLSGISVMRLLQAWIGLHPPKEALALAGVGLTLAPLVRARTRVDAPFRLMAMGALLVSMVIFNHMAESATFVIATCGVALWYVASSRGPKETALLALVFVLTANASRLPTELILRVVEPYALKAVPCILVWLVALWNLWTWERGAPDADAPLAALEPRGVGRVGQARDPSF
jgi:hypothetical protein